MSFSHRELVLLAKNLVKAQTVLEAKVYFTSFIVTWALHYILISAKDGGKRATRHEKDLLSKPCPVFTGDPFSGYVFPKQGSLGKPRVPLWSNSVCVQTSSVLNVNQPPSTNLSFRWVFGFCTCSAVLSWKGLVLHDAMLVSHTPSLLILGRSRKNIKCSFSFWITMWSLWRMPVSLFLWREHVLKWIELYWASGIF